MKWIRNDLGHVQIYLYIEGNLKIVHVVLTKARKMSKR